MENCHCDPLQKCLETFFTKMIMYGEDQFLNNSLGRKDLGDGPEEVSLEDVAKVFAEKVVNGFKAQGYETSRTGVTHKEDEKKITITIPREQLEKLEQNWKRARNAFEILRSFAFESKYSYLGVLGSKAFDSSFICDKLSLDVHGNMEMELNPSIVYKNVISWILDNLPRKCRRINSCCKHMKLEVGIEEFNDDDSGIIPLKTYRKFLTATYVIKAMGKSGYRVDSLEFVRLPANQNFHDKIMLIFTDSQDTSDEIERERATVFSFPVGDVHLQNLSIPNSPMSRVTSEFIFNLRFDQVNAVSLPRATEDQIVAPSWPEAIFNLTVATVNYDLLSKDPKSDVMFQYIDRDPNHAFQDTGSLLIMYNHARVLSILKTFEDTVEEGIYPMLPSFDEVNCSSFSKSELNLLHLLLQWPRTVENTVDLLRKEVNIEPLLQLVKEVTRGFIKFYTTERVLLKIFTPHNEQEMMKKVYLLKAIKCVYEEFFDLASIDYDINA